MSRSKNYGCRSSNLHTHSQYSILDATLSIPALKESGMKQVALTDHGNLFGAVNFYKTYSWMALRENRSSNAFHITLLAKNSAGYTNLVKLSSIGFIEGFYYVPRIDIQLLKIHNDDAKSIISLTKTLEGSIRNTGIHAAGLIVSGNPLMEHVPVATVKYSDIFVTQYSMKPEEMTFEILNHGKSLGIFQLESGGMQELAKQLLLDSFEEIITVLSLYRQAPWILSPLLLPGNKVESLLNMIIPGLNQYFKRPMESWSIKNKSCRLATCAPPCQL
ncbi:hypothetical protein ACTFIR_012797 [Dictyostelium discoideum]